MYIHMYNTSISSQICFLSSLLRARARASPKHLQVNFLFPFKKELHQVALAKNKIP